MSVLWLFSKLWPQFRSRFCHHARWMFAAASLSCVAGWAGGAVAISAPLPRDLDSGFGNSGRAGTVVANVTVSGALNNWGVRDPSLLPNLYATVVQRDGKIIVVGGCTFRFCVARFLANGTPDASFRGGGAFAMPPIVAPASGVWIRSPSAVAVQRDGMIVVVGTCNDVNFRHHICASRFLSNGNDDTSFGAGGTVMHAGIASARHEYGLAINIQPDGKIVLAGSCETASGSGAFFAYFCQARYLSNGDIDPSMPGSVTPIASPAGFTVEYSAIRSVTRSPDGTLTMAGHCGPLAAVANNRVCLSRIKGDGTLDLTFGAQGSIVTSQSAKDNFSVSSLRLPDGGLLVSSLAIDSGVTFLDLGRYSNDGNADTRYGVSGLVQTPVAIAVAGAALVAAADGRAVLAGACTGFGVADVRPCLDRYQLNGQNDTNFLATPVLGPAPSPVQNVPSAMAIQADGKLLLAGYCGSGVSTELCVFRYTGGGNDSNACGGDIDGDGRSEAVTDSLLLARVALGFRGTAVTQGITFLNTARRTTWPVIRDYLFNQCGMAISP